MNKNLIFSTIKSDALFVSKAINILYLTNFAGFSNTEREAFLLITKKNNYLITDSRYTEIAKKIKDFKFIEITKNTNLATVLTKLIAKEKIKSLAVSLTDLNVKEYKVLQKLIKLENDNSVIEVLREIKTKNELNNLKLASSLGDLVFEYILGQIKQNVSEIELAKKIEIFALQNNAEISFAPIVAFGANSASPHHKPTLKKLKRNTIVLLDFGVKVNGYCSDMTRTVFFGTATDKFKKIYKTVLEAQFKAIEYINSNKDKEVKTKDIDLIARNHILSQKFASIPHSFGHGIGLEVHESPRLSPYSEDVLKINQVFSLEPGIYLPNYGGVRIEDLGIFTSKGLVLISNAKKEIIEL